MRVRGGLCQCHVGVIVKSVGVSGCGGIGRVSGSGLPCGHSPFPHHTYRTSIRCAILLVKTPTRGVVCLLFHSKLQTLFFDPLEKTRAASPERPLERTLGCSLPCQPLPVFYNRGSRVCNSLWVATWRKRFSKRGVARFGVCFRGGR